MPSIREVAADTLHGIRKLNDFQHCRAKNAVYFGSSEPHTQTVLHYPDGKPVAIETTWVPAVFTAFREILDNALDEVVGHGHGNRIDISFDAERMIVSITDNGRGIPIDIDKATKQHIATMVMSNARAGRNFDTRGQVRGTNGIGASGVNFCSEWFEMDIWRDGYHFAQRFNEGKSPHENLVIEPPVIMPMEKKSKQQGTRVAFKLSPIVFPTMALPEMFVRSRIFEIALCYPKLQVYYNDKRIACGRSVSETLFPDAISIAVEEGNFTSHFWLVPEFFETERGDLVHSLVNGIPAFDGGAHVDAFRRGFVPGLLVALERESKRRRLVPNRGDVSDGMLIYNITQMDAPNFNSQSKTRLINEQAATAVRKALENEEFFKSLIKKNPSWIERIYARCQARTAKKDSSEATRIAKRNLRNKLPDLEDACGRDRSKCILFLGEGKSAIAGIVEARDPEIHGGLPLRGKVLNVHGKSAKQILENEALATVMTAIGLVPGQRANRHTLRYGKVYLAVDMDQDGSSIAALLVNFFYTGWPELFDPLMKPFIHVFMTPFIIATKGKQRKYWYGQDYRNFNPNDYKGWEVSRAKGLAALKKVDWQHALASPQLVPIVDDGRLAETLSLVFDAQRADDRKAWIGL